VTEGLNTAWDIYRSHEYHYFQRELINDYSDQPRPSHNTAVMLEGSCVLREGERETVIRPGEILYIPKYACYTSYWSGDPDIRFHTIHFNCGWGGSPLNGKRIPVQKLPVRADEGILEDFRYLHEHQKHPENEAFLVLSRFFTLCGKLFSSFEYEKLEKERSVQPALDFMEQNYRRNIRVSELARLCCMSESRFYSCFREETGVSPIQYKNTVCIQHAMDELILNPQKSVETIAQEYGFESAVYFRRVFKQRTGSTPAGYRRAGRTGK